MPDTGDGPRPGISPTDGLHPDDVGQQMISSTVLGALGVTG